MRIKCLSRRCRSSSSRPARARSKLSPRGPPPNGVKRVRDALCTRAALATTIKLQSGVTSGTSERMHQSSPSVAKREREESKAAPMRRKVRDSGRETRVRVGGKKTAQPTSGQLSCAFHTLAATACSMGLDCDAMPRMRRIASPALARPRHMHCQRQFATRQRATLQETGRGIASNVSPDSPLRSLRRLCVLTGRHCAALGVGMVRLS